MAGQEVPAATSSALVEWLAWREAVPRSPTSGRRGDALLAASLILAGRRTTAATAACSLPLSFWGEAVKSGPAALPAPESAMARRGWLAEARPASLDVWITP